MFLNDLCSPALVSSCMATQLMALLFLTHRRVSGWFSDEAVGASWQDGGTCRSVKIHLRLSRSLIFFFCFFFYNVSDVEAARRQQHKLFEWKLVDTHSEEAQFQICPLSPSRGCWCLCLSGLRWLSVHHRSQYWSNRYISFVVLNLTLMDHTLNNTISRIISYAKHYFVTFSGGLFAG